MIFSFFVGVASTLVAIGVYMLHRLTILRQLPCTACKKQGETRRLIKTLDFKTGVAHRGVLCGRCAAFADELGAPPWAE